MYDLAVMLTVTLKILVGLKSIGGHSKTTWTTFCPILTTYLPIVDFCGHAYNFQVHFGLPSNPINIHKQKLPGKKIS